MKTNNNATDHQTYATQMKGKTGIQRIIKAAGYSKDGFIAAYKSEAAFRQVVLLMPCLSSLWRYHHLV